MKHKQINSIILILEIICGCNRNWRDAQITTLFCEKAIAFKHDNAMGNAPAHRLFKLIDIGRNADGDFRKIDHRLDNLAPARAFSDYIVKINHTDLPEGVEILNWV